MRIVSVKELMLVGGCLRKSADCVIGVNAASILVVHRHTGIAIANIGHDGIE